MPLLRLREILCQSEDRELSSSLLPGLLQADAGFSETTFGAFSSEFPHIAEIDEGYWALKVPSCSRLKAIRMAQNKTRKKHD